MFAFLKPKKQPVKLAYRFASSMTIEQWRATPDMVKKAGRLLEQHDLRLMLEALRNKLFTAITPDGAPDVYQRAIGQALAQGYQNCLSDFESLGLFKAPEQPLKETFEEEEHEPE